MAAYTKNHSFFFRTLWTRLFKSFHFISGSLLDSLNWQPGPNTELFAVHLHYMNSPLATWCYFPENTHLQTPTIKFVFFFLPEARNMLFFFLPSFIFLSLLLSLLLPLSLLSVSPKQITILYQCVSLFFTYCTEIFHVDLHYKEEAYSSLLEAGFHLPPGHVMECIWKETAHGACRD